MKKNKKSNDLIENISKMGKDLVVMKRKDFVRLMEDELSTYEMFDEAMNIIKILNKENESLNARLNNANKEIERLNEALLVEMD